MYSRKMGNVFHSAKALKANIISAPERWATLAMVCMLRRSLLSSKMYVGLLISLNVVESTVIMLSLLIIKIIAKVIFLSRIIADFMVFSYICIIKQYADETCHND